MISMSQKCNFLQIIMDIVPANVKYTLAMVFLVFREVVNVLNNYCFHTENMHFLATNKLIFCTKTLIT